MFRASLVTLFCIYDIIVYSKIIIFLNITSLFHSLNERSVYNIQVIKQYATPITQLSSPGSVRGDSECAGGYKQAPDELHRGSGLKRCGVRHG